ncbi:hypothetical protein [Listeria booriae]|uniref:Uncharacterized protein n=1 Tax=Listeria booriae TaxID=1552123 RepID=A0A841X7Y5_9LIST|nr:hypothetical protein [Listeria booriae]MBC1286995.1 hypothetical protein [Listeria booriae]MBC2242372.1 hypothetical protein [Listeria booriae]
MDNFDYHIKGLYLKGNDALHTKNEIVKAINNSEVYDSFQELLDFLKFDYELVTIDTLYIYESYDREIEKAIQRVRIFSKEANFSYEIPLLNGSVIKLIDDNEVK